jgi:hypothetical protein
MAGGKATGPGGGKPRVWSRGEESCTHLQHCVHHFLGSATHEGRVCDVVECCIGLSIVNGTLYVVNANNLSDL